MTEEEFLEKEKEFSEEELEEALKETTTEEALKRGGHPPKE